MRWLYSIFVLGFLSVLWAEQSYKVRHIRLSKEGLESNFIYVSQKVAAYELALYNEEKEKIGHVLYHHDIQKKLATICDLFIKSEQRKCGLGRKLLMHCVELLKAKHIKKVQLYAYPYEDADNKELMKKLTAFYTSCGFVGKRKSCFGMWMRMTFAKKTNGIKSCFT